MATFGTFTAGQVLTAAELNTAGEWQAYTPTWTQSATITKTVNWARFTQLGKWVQGSVKMTASSGGTSNNKILVGLPVNASSNNFVLGTAHLIDESFSPDGFYYLGVTFESASTISFIGTQQPVSTDQALRFGQTGGPTFQIASGDIIHVQFAYEAA
jgi:hypothetical protein